MNGIYDYHHFHSNTHEVLGIASGVCEVQLGGDDSLILKVEAEDCLVIPAGVAHKNKGCSIDFVCIGAYPTSIPYDMHERKKEELSKLIEEIARAPLPKKDSIFGDSGPIFEYWNG